MVFICNASLRVFKLILVVNLEIICESYHYGSYIDFESDKSVMKVLFFSLHGFYSLHFFHLSCILTCIWGCIKHTTNIFNCQCSFMFAHVLSFTMLFNALCSSSGTGIILPLLKFVLKFSFNTLKDANHCFLISLILFYQWKFFPTVSKAFLSVWFLAIIPKWNMLDVTRWIHKYKVHSTCKLDHWMWI